MNLNIFEKLSNIIMLKGNKSLKFPRYEDLSYEQKSAICLDENSNNLVIGAPGTGKTIVALYRLHELYSNGIKNNIMLVFNRPLKNYIESVQKDMGWVDEFKVYTVNDWVYSVLYSGSEEQPNAGGYKSSFVPNKENNKWKIDWYKIRKDFIDNKELYEHIVVDEGQDFPKDFYYLIVHIAKNVSIYSDPNQSLQKDNTSVSDILEIINKDSHWTLTLNYRNSRAIANFTRNYCYDRSIFAESYKVGDDLFVYNYVNEETCYKNILNIISKYDNETEIGIIVPNVEGVDDGEKRKLSYGIYDYLTNNLDSKYEVEIYYNTKTSDEKNNDKKNIDFNKKSIKIFNYMTVRGLDFDVVILLDNVSHNISYDIQNQEEDNLISNLNRIYVSATRTKTALHAIIIGEEINLDEYYANDINTDFPVLHNGDKMDYYMKAREYYNSGNHILSLYYLHYLLSIMGFDDDFESYQDAVILFADICEKYNKNDFALSIIINYENKYELNEELKNIKERLLENSYKNKKSRQLDEVDIQDEQKKIKKFEIVSITTYLCGLDKDRYLKENYCEGIFNDLEHNKQTKIIRSLCILRNVCFSNYTKIKAEKKPIYSCDVIPQDIINYLSLSNVIFSDKDYKGIESFEIRLNELIQERIGNVIQFYKFINFDYIKDLFVIPNGTNYSAIQSEVNKFHQNSKLYPFGLYVHWSPREMGNLFLDDKTFCIALYDQHKDRFEKENRVVDASILTRKDFGDFVERNNKLLLIVDCENTDVYKLLAALKGLDEDDVSKIDKMILIDDINTTDVWKLIQNYIQIKVEYCEVQRLNEEKSLVDHTLILKCANEINSNHYDGIIVSSSDSDFSVFVNEYKDIGFFYLIQSKITSKDFINMLDANRIKYCNLEDFDISKAEYIIDDIFKYYVKDKCKKVFNGNAVDFIKNILLTMRLKLEEQEIKSWLKKYIKQIKIDVGENNNFEIKL